MAKPAKKGKRKSQVKSGKNPAKAESLKVLSYIILVFAFLLYGNTVMHDYALDDDIITRGNRFVQEGISGIPDILNNGYLFGFNGTNDQSYRPLVLINMAIEKQMGGNNPHVHHFFNVLLYGLCGMVLFSLLSKLFKQVHISVPMIITLLFLAHPLHTEVVANIKSRDEILSLLFGLLSLNFFISYSQTEIKKQLLYGIGCFFLALLSKENSITFLVISPLTLYFFTDTSPKRIIQLTLFLAGIAIFYLIIRFSVMDKATFGNMEVINNALMGAKSYSEKLASAILLLGMYLKLLLLPHPLSWDYSYNQIPLVSWSDVRSILSLLIYAGLAIYAGIRFKKKDVIAYCILFYFITLSVVSNIFIPIGATMAERFLFTPSLGFCIAIPVLLFRLPKTNIPGKPFRVFYILSGAILTLYSIKTIARNPDWKNNYSLFLSGVETAPNSARTHFALASEYRLAGEKEQNHALKEEWLNKSVSENKRSIEIYPQNAEAWYNLGVTYYVMNDPEKAAEAYRETLKINPNYNNALNNLGVIYFNSKRFEEALKCFTKAIQVDPNNSDPYGNIGACYHNMGDYQNAIVYYEKALVLNPGNVNVRNNLNKLKSQ